MLPMCLRALKFVNVLLVILSSVLLVVSLWRWGHSNKAMPSPLTGILLGYDFYHCVAMAVAFTTSVLCHPTATLILCRNCKGDIKSQVLISVDV